MGFNLEEMKSNLNFGGARPSKFDVQVTNKIDISGDYKFKFTCKAASLPVSEIGSIDVFYKGRPVSIAGDRPPFPEWVVTVHNDEDFLVKNAFERWLSGINQHQGNITGRGVTSNPNSYKSDALVHHYAKDNEIVPIKTARFIGLYPVRVGEIALDWDSQNQIEVFEVAFKYDYWVSAGTTDGI